MTPLLEARAASLPNRLRPTDLVVEAPQLVALIGPNGSGKTSLLHALAGIGAPLGEILIEGRPLAAAGRRRQVSFLPASRDIAWPLTARDLVLLGLPRGAEENEADEAMAALALEDFRDRRVDRLSTGERSRVLIARALAPGPRLLLLDEPVANLDPLWQLRLMEMLRSATSERGQAVIAAMHDLDLAARYADRLILMEGGAIAADGEPQGIMGSQRLGEVFGIERGPEGWRPRSASLPRSGGEGDHA
ncbi:MAG: ABC transporter ATP-binding protein [Allosphingosinicella sp.]